MSLPVRPFQRAVSATVPVVFTAVTGSVVMALIAVASAAPIVVAEAAAATAICTRCPAI